MGCNSGMDTCQSCDRLKGDSLWKTAVFGPDPPFYDAFMTLLTRLALVAGIFLCWSSLSVAAPTGSPDLNRLSPVTYAGPPLWAQADDSMDSGFDGFDEFESEFEASKPEVYDPLEGYNRTVTGFNDWLYLNLLDPVARGWAWAVPEPARISVRNFFKNLMFPVRFANNALQLKAKNTGEETARFAINSTVGVLGLFDPAKAWFNLEEHPEDFGQTLGHYGVGGGFHIVLPFFGPSNLRDTTSLYPDWLLDPTNERFLYRNPSTHHVLYGRDYDPAVPYAVKGLEVINRESLRLGQYESLRQDAVDLYPFLRDVYEQNRQKEIEE